MLKKIFHSSLVFCMFIGLFLPSSIYGQTEENSISSDTLITEDNIYEVLEYLGIDSSNFIKEDTEIKTDQTITVGYLEDLIKQVEKEPKVITDISSAPTNPDLSNNNATYNPMSSGTVMLYDEVEGGSFTVTFRVSARYRDGAYTSAGAALASVSTTRCCGVAHGITSESLKTSIVNGRVRMQGEVTVTAYLFVDQGRIKLADYDIKVDKYWNTSFIPN